jgi:hypothetical protein
MATAPVRADGVAMPKVPETAEPEVMAALKEAPVAVAVIHRWAAAAMAGWAATEETIG